MKILIARQTNKLKNGNRNPKDYPHWDEFLELVKEHEIKEIQGILTTQQILELVNWCDVWISIDSFLPHFVAYHKLKRGIVIWGQSDPKKFGYESNINLLKNKKYLRNDQYRWWEDVDYKGEAFVSPELLQKSISMV